MYHDWISPFVATTIIFIAAITISSHSLVSATSLSQPKCTNRFELRHEIRNRSFTNCDELIRGNPLCAEDFVVAWTAYPPYIFRNEHTKKISGILPSMIETALESCCFLCNKVIYSGPYVHTEMFFLENVSFALPAQTSIKSTEYMGNDYVHLLPVSHIGIFGIPPKPDPIKNGETLMWSIAMTYPLLILVIFMCLTAGICVWVLDSKWNTSDFPASFPQGPIEGTWWAFVSMTTVGYGDKSPKGLLARIFAAVWMLVGITIISIYTATLTSALMSVFYQEAKISFYQKKVAILDQTSVGIAGVTKINAKPVLYEDLDSLVKGVLNGEAVGFALDDYMVNFFQEELYELGLSQYRLLQRVSLDDISFGMVGFNSSQSQLFQHFFQSNDDNRKLMAALGMEGHQHQGSEKEDETKQQFFAVDSPLYLITLVALGVLCVGFTLLGLCVNKAVVKTCNKNEEDGRERQNNNGGDDISLLQIDNN